MRKVDWSKVEEAQGYDRPKPGAYIVRIEHVEDVESKEYLRIEWDFAEGPYKGENKETFRRAGFWPITLIRSYKEKALPFFKAFKTAVETSNPGYTFSEDRLDDLRGKYFGVVLGEEEYRANSGEVRTRLYVAYVHSGQAIRSGNHEDPPPLKTLADRPAPMPNGVTVMDELDEDDGDLPF